MNAGKTIAFSPEAWYGPPLNSVELAKACDKLGHEAVESRYNLHGFRGFRGDDL